MKFKILVKVVDLKNKIIDLALSDNTFRDYKDGLQYYTALEAESDIIITRNLKDFQSSKIPVMTAAQFLQR